MTRERYRPRSVDRAAIAFELLMKDRAEGRSTEELAARVGCKIDTIRSLLRTLRKRGHVIRCADGMIYMEATADELDDAAERAANRDGVSG